MVKPLLVPRALKSLHFHIFKISFVWFTLRLTGAGSYASFVADYISLLPKPASGLLFEGENFVKLRMQRYGNVVGKFCALRAFIAVH